MNWKLTLIFPPAILLIFLLLFLYSTEQNKDSFASISSSCNTFHSYSTTVNHALQFSLEYHKKSNGSLLLELFYHHTSPLYAHYFAENLYRQQGIESPGTFRLIQTAISLKPYIRDTNQLQCLYTKSLSFRGEVTTLSSLSHYYFGRPVEELTLIEVVRLVTALPGLEMSPYSHSEQFNIKAKTVLSRLLKVNLINEQDYNFSIQDFK